MPRSREEQETVIRFDETDADAYLWTASPRQTKRWQRAGCLLKTEPGGWSTRVPKAAVSRCRPRLPYVGYTMLSPTVRNRSIGTKRSRRRLLMPRMC